MNLLGFRRRSVLGIDIGGHSIKMVEMRVDREKPLITRAEYVLMDISVERKREIQRAMKDLLNIAKPSVKRAVANIPSNDERVVMHTIFMPDVTSDISDEEIIEITKSEVEKQDYIPYHIDEALISFDLLGETTVNEEKALEIFFVAVPKELSEERAMLLRRFGIQTLAIDLDVLALARLVGNMEIVSDEESIAVIDMGSTKSFVFFYLRGKPIFYPHIPRGGNELTEEVSRELQVEWNEAERMKIELDDPRVEEVLKFAMERPQGLVQALRDRFEHYMADYPAPTRVILAGGTAQLPFMEEFLGTKLGFPVERINYLDQFDLDEKRDLKLLKDNQALFATAVGLALKMKG